MALLALSLQRRFDTRPDKTSLLLPVATATNNHEVVWLGVAGVGNAYTLNSVVQPLAETASGPNGYSKMPTEGDARQALSNFPNRKR